jgi:hypothetical protein
VSEACPVHQSRMRKAGSSEKYSVEGGQYIQYIVLKPMEVRPISQVSNRRQYQHKFSGIRPLIPRKPNSGIGTITKLRDYPISIIENLANFD